MNTNVAFQCPNPECGRMIVGVYETVKGATSHQYRYRDALPKAPAPPDVPDTVAGRYPAFVEIYGQALAADVHGLTEIHGLGLRKAAEVLIKSYVIDYPPPERDVKKGDDEAYRAWVPDAPFMQVIQTIPDPRLRAMAERAAWLGNDHGHFLRKYHGHDVPILERVIRLAMNLVDGHLLVIHFEEDIQPGGSEAAVSADTSSGDDS